MSKYLVIMPVSGGDYSYGGASRASTTSSSPRKGFKKERTDAETKEVLDHLLRDDVSGLDNLLCLWGLFYIISC